MAIQATSEEQLKFKKRARQRLLGAAALLLTAAIVLPLVLDATPRQQNADVVIDMVNPAATKLAEPVVPLVPAKTEAVVSSSITDATATPLTTPKDNSEIKLAKINSVSEKTANDVAQPDELKAKVTPKAEQVIESKPEPKSEPKVVAKPDVKVELKEVTKPKQEIKKPEVKVESKAAVKVEPKVVAKAEPKSSIATSSDKTPVSSQHFVVQLGAFSNAENVHQLCDRLAAVGVVTYTEKLPSGATRVRVGPYADKAQADKVLAKINAAGVQAQVVPLK
jgi:DedD protein